MADYNRRKQSLCEMPFFSITNVELHKCMPKNDCFHQFTEAMWIELQAEMDLNTEIREHKRQDKIIIKEAVMHLDSTLDTISTYIKSFGKNKLIFRLLKCIEKEVQDLSQNLKPSLAFMTARRLGPSESEDDSDDSTGVLYLP